MAGETTLGILEHTPSLDASARASVTAAREVPASASAVGIPVAASGKVPAEVGLDRAALTTAGFDGSVGSTLIVPTTGGQVRVAVGVGEARELDAARLRDAAGAFGRATASHRQVAFALGPVTALPVEVAAQAVAEGVLLARYRYDVLRSRIDGEAASEADARR